MNDNGTAGSINGMQTLPGVQAPTRQLNPTFWGPTTKVAWIPQNNGVVNYDGVPIKGAPPKLADDELLPVTISLPVQGQLKFTSKDVQLWWLNGQQQLVQLKNTTEILYNPTSPPTLFVVDSPTTAASKGTITPFFKATGDATYVNGAPDTFNIFSVTGPFGVPEHTINAYRAINPEAPAQSPGAFLTPGNGTLSGTPNSDPATSTVTQNISWPGGPAYGKVVFQPATNWAWGFAVAIVHVVINPQTPTFYDGAGASNKEGGVSDGTVNPTKNNLQAIRWKAVVTLSGPAFFNRTTSISAGVANIQVGFIQSVVFSSYQAVMQTVGNNGQLTEQTLDIPGSNDGKVFSAFTGKTFLDKLNQATNAGDTPWIVPPPKGLIATTKPTPISMADRPEKWGVRFNLQDPEFKAFTAAGLIGYNIEATFTTMIAVTTNTAITPTYTSQRDDNPGMSTSTGHSPPTMLRPETSSRRQEDPLSLSRPMWSIAITQRR